MNDAAWVTAYVRKSLQTVEDFAADAAGQATLLAMAAAIGDALKGGGKLLVAGNGGSAGDAQHIAGEFVVRLMYDRAPLAGDIADDRRLGDDRRRQRLRLRARVRAAGARARPARRRVSRASRPLAIPPTSCGRWRPRAPAASSRSASAPAPAGRCARFATICFSPRPPRRRRRSRSTSSPPTSSARWSSARSSRARPGPRHDARAAGKACGRARRRDRRRDDRRISDRPGRPHLARGAGSRGARRRAQGGSRRGGQRGGQCRRSRGASEPRRRRRAPAARRSSKPCLRRRAGREPSSSRIRAVARSAR